MAHLEDQAVQPALHRTAKRVRVQPGWAGETDVPRRAHRLAAQIDHLRPRIMPDEGRSRERRDRDAEIVAGAAQGVSTSIVAL